MLILPRQARDKHKENSKKDAFLQANYDGKDIMTLWTSRKSDCATRCEQDTRCKLFTSAPGGRNGKRSCRFKHENSTLGGGMLCTPHI